MNYVKSLAKQLASKGIRVNAVAPGPIWTPLQVSGGATQESWRSSAVRLPSAGRANLLSSDQSACNWRCRMRALRPARSTAPQEEAGSPEAYAA